MVTKKQQRIKVEDAAKLLYQTQDPTVVQISKVRYRLQEGALQGSPKGDWVAAESIAKYMASRSQHKSTIEYKASRLDNSADSESSASEQYLQNLQASTSTMEQPGLERQAVELPNVYREMLSDYFFAVIRKKQPKRTSVAFERAVLAGQILFILFPLAVIGFAYSQRERANPEQILVENHLSHQFDRYEIEQWSPVIAAPTGAGKIVRVKFAYYEQGLKAIHTDRKYQIVGDQVSEFTDTD